MLYEYQTLGDAFDLKEWVVATDHMFSSTKPQQKWVVATYHLNCILLPSVYFPLMFRLWYEICVVWHIFPSDVLIKVFAPSDALFLICFPSPYSKRWFSWLHLGWNISKHDWMGKVSFSSIRSTGQAIFLYLFWIFQNYFTLYERYIIHLPHKKETK